MLKLSKKRIFYTYILCDPRKNGGYKFENYNFNFESFNYKNKVKI